MARIFKKWRNIERHGLPVETGFEHQYLVHVPDRQFYICWFQSIVFFNGDGKEIAGTSFVDVGSKSPIAGITDYQQLYTPVWNGEGDDE